MVAVPVSTIAATAAWVSSASPLDTTSTSRRGTRSASTPPNNSSSTLVNDRAPTTSPRSFVDPVRSSTANASAIGASALPAIDTTRPPVR
jgi:hypothetical protein